MKRVLFLILFQLYIVNIAISQNKDIQKYDSLSAYIEVDSLSKYINQNIYISNSKGARIVGFTNFYSTLGGTIYSPYGSTGKLNNPDSVCGRIFRINSVGVYNNNKYMQLVDDFSKESLFYVISDKYNLDRLILYGYFIKMKELLLNNMFYDVSISEKPLKCDSVYMREDYLTSEIIAKFSNGFTEEASPIIIKRSNDYLQRQKYLEEIDKKYEMLYIERKLAIKKYGYVRIGMKRAIVFKVCGYPDKINTTTTRYGESEQFIYGEKLYIYIDNGKVSAIQDYQ